MHAYELNDDAPPVGADDLEDIPAIDEAGNAVPPKRKNGRPKGAKDSKPRKKKKGSAKRAVATPAGAEPEDDAPEDVIPEELKQMAAMLPLQLGGALVAIRTGGEVHLTFPLSTVKMVTAAFDAWLATTEINITPGWSLIGAYGLAFAQAMKLAAEEAAHASARSAEQPAGGAVAPA